MTVVEHDELDAKYQEPPQGLTSSEVEKRIQRGEVNTFEARVGRSYREIFRYNIFNAFNLVLFFLLGTVILLQDYNTVIFAGFSVVMNSLIGTVQEIDAKRKLNKLADLAPKQVQVWRDGKRTAISNQQVVKDDLIAIAPGDMLVVDGIVVESDSLEIDESQLTGESDAVYKMPDDKVSSGTYCISGTGKMVATHVGRHSTVNKLAATAKIYKNPITPTQRKISIIVQFTLIVMAICLPMIMIAGYNNGDSFLEITRGGVVFVTSLVPQGLILIVILSLTIGAVKISRHQTLVQRVNAVESLANVTVLCFDKTGTLTENQLTVTEVIPLNNVPSDEIKQKLAHYIFTIGHQNSTAAAVAEYLHDQQITADVRKIREIPFTSRRKWGAVVFENHTLVVGAPERIIGDDNVCDISEYTRQGLRVLALGQMIEAPQPDQLSVNTHPIALITIRDQVRDDIHETLSAFIEQGVRPKVISGDNLETVRAVGNMAGMKTGLAYTGDELDAMSKSEFDDAVKQADVFARVEPDTKKRIIAALRNQGEYVAMVGDGVNDVPALKEADLAVTMNDGAQISKDIADIVLLNNAMSTLPLAFKEGTEITQTLFGTTKMFLAKDTFNTLLFLFTMLMTLPFPITPIQISWASFGTTNMTGGLIALGIMRPSLIKNFREDVLDYFIIAGVTGGVGMALMNLVIVNYTDTETARHAMTIAIMLYQITILWHIAGIDPLRPRTFLSNPLVMLISGVLCLITIGAALIFPETFEFGMPPAEVLLFMFVVYLLLISLVSVGMRNRGLLHRFYSLTRKETR